MSTQTLALVVARGGSKGVPRKNLRIAGGQPLIAYTFLAARRSRLLDRTIISTDDAEIAAAARLYGVEVPFMRPAALAQDGSHIMDATLYALDWLDRNDGYRPEQVMLLQPTSPFRTEEDIDQAILLALERRAPAIVSVCECHRHPYLAKRIEADGRMRAFIESDFQTSLRQRLPEAYDLNGAIYLVRRDVLLEERSWCPRGTHAYVMPPERSMDIDTLWDLHVADRVIGKGAVSGLGISAAGEPGCDRPLAAGREGAGRRLRAQRPTRTTCDPAPVAIAKRRIGRGHPCFVIAEAGVNHNGDPEMARRLVDAAADAAAVALGASVIEKHFTLDRTLPGPDHRASLTPDELATMIRGSRTVESALGDGVQRPVSSEVEIAAVARRSVVARRAIKAGTILCLQDLAIKRPGTGLPSSMLPRLLGRRVRVAIAPGALLSLEMIA